MKASNDKRGEFSVKPQQSEAAAERRTLTSEIEVHWRPALGRLEANLNLAHHLGREFNQAEMEAKRFGAMRHALFLLHANACLVGSEIVALLRTGHANGAEARWRSLHEIAVYAEFIRQSGDDVAKKYLDHNIVKAWEDAKAWNRQAPQCEQFPAETMAQLEADVTALRREYGDAYSDGFGWAINAFRMRNPEARGNRLTFEQLRKRRRFRGHFPWAISPSQSRRAPLIERSPLQSQ